VARRTQLTPSSTITDALGRPCAVGKPPERIVSLVPSLSEALFAFGLGERIAGVTRFCVEPREGVAGKAKVGGTKTLDVAAVESLRPDLIIASAEENRAEDVSRLIDGGWPVFVTLPTSVASAIDLLGQLAALTDSAEAARPIIREAEDALAAARAANAAREPLRVFCPIWRNPYMTIGPDTYMHDVIAVCGGRNVFEGRQERYPKVELEEMAALDPEVILLPSEPYRFRRRHLADFEAFPQVAAVRRGNVLLVDGRMLSWHGPRIGGSLRALRALLEGAQRVDKSGGDGR
jgi:ABC-type Fe3+-hydroxamate transport system substrate-binding protein